MLILVTREERRQVSYEAVQAIAETTGELALVTVVDVQGSAPRHPGSKMVVRRTPAGGTPGLEVVAGTVGGGKGEARAIALAGECIGTRAARVLTLEFQGTDIEGPDMICGGTSRLLVEPLDQDRAPYRLALERLRRGERTLFVKSLGQALAGAAAAGAVAAGAVAVLDERGAPLYGAVPPSVGEHAGRALAAGRALLLQEEDVFLDPVFPDEKLLILGGGYVGQAVAWHAARLGFTITVADDRGEFSAEGRFPPGVQAVCGPYTSTVEKFPFDSATYVVMVTRGHLTDLECVRAVLRRRWRYAGFIGSARKGRLLREQLSRDGFDAAAIGQLHSPIGISIGAETPDELAVSILAEMIAVRRAFDRPPANA
jgi:xanthine dehydrogenase accessory factor